MVRTAVVTTTRSWHALPIPNGSDGHHRAGARARFPRDAVGKAFPTASVSDGVYSRLAPRKARGSRACADATFEASGNASRSRALPEDPFVDGPPG